MPWLVADIGGTNARFALIEGLDAPPVEPVAVACDAYSSLADAAESYLAGRPGPPPRWACLAVAGPVEGDLVRLTNRAWRFSVEATRRRLGLERLVVVSDFSALAMALPGLGAAELLQLGGDRPVADAPRAVVGPGTGLGVAGLVRHGARWTPLATEGGHVDCPAFEEEEIAAVRILRGAEGRAVSAEYLLSGGGLVRLRRAIAELRGIAAEPLEPTQVLDRAVSGGDPLCDAALSMFCGLLGGFAGNVVLTLGARGGLYLGGGILPRIPKFLQASAFRRRFEAKGPMADYLCPVPAHLILRKMPALDGAAACLAALCENGAIPGAVSSP